MGLTHSLLACYMNTVGNNASMTKPLHKLLHSPKHSAWSESSAARPTARGGRREGEKLAPGAFATLQRRGLQGRADEPVFGSV